VRKRPILYFTKRSILERPQRIFLMVIAVSMAVSLLVSMITVAGGMRKRLADELKAYGANAIVSSSEYLGEAVAELLKQKKGVIAIPELYGRLCLSGKGQLPRHQLMLNVIGMPSEAMKELKITGTIPSTREVLIGRRLKEAGGFSQGAELNLSENCDSSSTERFIISGVFERVGPEDSGIIMELHRLQEILGLKGKVSVVLLRISPEDFEDTIQELKSSLPDIEIRPIRQVALSEERLLKKIETLMLIVLIVVVLASVITVAGMMASTIFERLVDIALMKTMGGTSRQIQTFFILEAFIVGVMGSFLGLITGIIAAQAITLSAFHKTVAIPVIVIPVAFFIGIIISVLSGIPALKRVTAYRPSIILRGEI
jgi:putative ABC transport system permease protein